MAIKTGKELAEKCKYVAKNYKTLYVLGCIGAPLNAANKDRYCRNLPYNSNSVRTAKIRAASADTFGFDCVCFVKSLLWGWNGDKSKTYGGAKYKSNGVPDINADAMIKVCKEVSTNFSNVEVGEFLWMEGHCGVYIGGGLAVECTPIWKDGVQITAVGNIGPVSGYNSRTWTKHGKLPYITYEPEKVEEPKPDTTPDANDGIKAGDIVSIAKGAVYYGTTKKVPDWAIAKNWIVGRDPQGSRVYINKSEDGKNTINSAIDAKYLTVVKSAGSVVKPVAEIKVGSIVRVKQGAKAINGVQLADFVYTRNHTVKSISGNRAVITFNGVVVAAVHKDDLILV